MNVRKCLVAFGVLAMLFSTNINVLAKEKEKTNTEIAFPGGDCFANRASGDTYLQGNESYCNPLIGEKKVYHQEVKKKKKHKKSTIVTPIIEVIVINVPEEHDCHNTQLNEFHSTCN